MKKIFKLNQQGFSLIELMVVVAIIAILATFAIPQYQSFQSKARQKEGMTLLNSYYVAAMATQAEMGVLPGNFVGTGFNPAGQVHYRITSQNGATPTYGPNNTTCVSTVNNCGGYGTWTEVTSGAFAANAVNTCTVATTSASGTFTACASANIRPNSGADVDTWSINQAKTLTNTNDGIN
ncbi:MAG: prepilin-type N-terminal cleavage/methylation domain-containing protein [Bdellovibrionaceae bacterium]|nr:prepilin-type N-terminal cleavage/methylation domain-containing protein [Pseudobdellovibrionaceae bacterium]